ncbi:hypothetical protein [Methylobacterium oxalidis]|uniref:Uncharacterized protein n=1 Tax=Methylobacterium oxalidis TaxID=944322 RepID=A0A512IX39_9HYPH|nr:hypothetical protein [Methylobacterium oxalidis]GEP02290.1 hypothetical protein MOX02_03280 [Methylobacterium oxalidis]GJE32280.1 hypothetical protein LDDCCGHA_2466 [Methylobacterium oxalidis]GLS62235.1 hypothetical protein GCM10007888_06160 [Methylobacterium oxalidis]
MTKHIPEVHFLGQGRQAVAIDLETALNSDDLDLEAPEHSWTDVVQARALLTAALFCESDCCKNEYKKFEAVAYRSILMSRYEQIAKGLFEESEYRPSEPGLQRLASLPEGGSMPF